MAKPTKTVLWICGGLLAAGAGFAASALAGPGSAPAASTGTPDASSAPAPGTDAPEPSASQAAPGVDDPGPEPTATGPGEVFPAPITPWTLTASELTAPASAADGFVAGPGSDSYGARTLEVPFQVANVLVADAVHDLTQGWSADSWIVGINATTGEEIWQIGPAHGECVASSDATLIGCPMEPTEIGFGPITDIPFLIFDVTTGDVRHEVTVGLEPSAVLWDDDAFVLVGWVGDGISATRVNTDGTVLWSEMVDVAEGWEHGFSGASVAAGELIVGDGAGREHAYDARTGEPLSGLVEFPTAEIATSTGPVVAAWDFSDDISDFAWFLYDQNEQVLAEVSASGAPLPTSAQTGEGEYIVFSSGDETCTHELATGTDSCWGTAVHAVVSGLPVSLSNDGHLVTALDPTTGSELWRLELTGTAVATSGGILEVHTDELGLTPSLTFYPVLPQEEAG